VNKTANQQKTSGQSEPASIWDNDLPAGNSPPRPRAPLIAAAVAYGGWLVFLLVMVILRMAYKA
jgi:hypothetical protein